MKFMTSQRGYQTITIYILPNISQSKGNQTMRFGQLVIYNEFFFKNHAKYEEGRQVADLSFVFLKKLYMR